MKKFRKLTALIMAGTMLASLCACSKDSSKGLSAGGGIDTEARVKPTTSYTSKEDIDALLAELFPNTEYSSGYSDQREHRDNSYEEYFYEREYEGVVNSEFSGTIKVDGDDITIYSTSFKDLEAMGWNYENPADKEVVLTRHGHDEYNFLNESGKVAKFGCNSRDKEQEYRDEIIVGEEGLVSYVDLNRYEYDDAGNLRKLDSAATFEMDGNINHNSTLEDVLQKYGSPYFLSLVVYENHTYVWFRYFENGHVDRGVDCVEFYFDGEENRLYRVDIDD